MNKNIYAAIAALGLTVGLAADEVQFSELPKAAQNAINRNLNGGTVQDIDRTTKTGRTLYDVDIRREGANKKLRVDADGKLWPNDAQIDGDASLDVDTDKSDGKITDKNDGKILGVIDTPRRDNDLEAEAEVGDDGVRVETNLEKPKDRGVSEDIFDKNDGKILDVLPAPSRNRDAQVEADVDVDDDAKIEADVDIDTDDNKVVVETNKREDKGIFRKGDGKILGIPVPGRNRANNEVVVSSDSDRNEVTTDADGGLDTDNEDGRVLGVPKRGFETLSLRDVPPVVRETIRREAGGYKVAEIERATVDGQGVYEVDIEREGANRELHIAANGTILKDSDRENVGSPARREQGRSEQK